jgi:hypothetical protein
VIARRFPTNPIIRPHMDDRMGDNINGPSLIRVPDWITRPLGRYYLYFAHHDGRYIRLAYADDLTGLWRTHPPGVLGLATARFAGHVASPDAHVDHAARQIRLYYHGADQPSSAGVSQATRVALSNDGLHFTALPALLGRPYFRVFQWRGDHYALAMPGMFYRSRDGLVDFVEGPTLFEDRMRHTALLLDGDRLTVFYTNAGDCPERILRATVALTPDWSAWRASAPDLVLAPELPYEGADLPCLPSRRGLTAEPVHQVRDPAIFREDGRTYLLYTVAGERGIAIAELLEGGER